METGKLLLDGRGLGRHLAVGEEEVARYAIRQLARPATAAFELRPGTPVCHVGPERRGRNSLGGKKRGTAAALKTICRVSERG